ncbi:MAG: ABC transporter permease [Candidatus Aenigmarchaeota archaeon]|nr:ABC transporter permease [Candidatus Aenigmarchaeota archaeon]
MNGIYTIWLRELKRFIRAKPRLIGSLMMPFIWLAIMGVGLSSSFTVPNSGINYLKFISPGIIGMSLLFTSIFSAISVIWDKQFGFLKEMLVAPISRTSIVVGKVVGSVTISLINALMVLVIAVVLGGISLADLSLMSMLSAVLFMILISVSFVSIGLAIASKLNNLEGFQVIMSSLVMPLFFLSGAFFPIENVPLWMKTLAHIDPLMYGVDGLRASLLGVSQFSILFDLSVLAAFSVAMILFSSFLFRKMN